jgi:hypothetical protein
MEAKRKLVLTIVGGLLLYLASTGVSFAAFRFLGQPTEMGPISPLPEAREGLRVDLSQPKTEECLLNGGMFTKDERKIWEKRRPLTVMIENHAEARPQSGLSRADIVYEAVAEGGITRFLVVYYCGGSAEDVVIGPVRSARTYFLDFASEYGDYPLYAHVGGANLPGPANALGQIGDYGWLRKGNDLNQFSIGFPTFWRDYERIGHPVATEHTMYSTTDRLWEVAHKRSLDAKDDEGEKWDESFKVWEFKDEADLDERGGVEKIDFDFWSNYSEYSVSWQYDREANLYQRFNNSQAHKDLNNDEHLQAKIVIALLVKEKGPIDELKHLLYTTTGKGQAFVFQDGQVIKGTWQKEERESRTKFLDSRGKEIALNRGLIWIEIIPAHQEVEY